MFIKDVSIHKLRIVKIIHYIFQHNILAVKQNEHNCKRDPTYSTILEIISFHY
jgi:hypothetical protein